MSQEHTRSQDRNKRIINTFIASGITKGITLGCGFASITLAYGAMGLEQFSLWMTITTIIGALQFADLGIGNGLLNMMAVAKAQNDREYARRAVSSSTVILILLCIGILAIFSGSYPFLDWSKIYNISSDGLGGEIGMATAIMVVCLALNLPLLTAQRVQMGYQDGLKANIWISLGPVLSLTSVLFCSQTGAGLPAFILSSLGGAVVAAALCWIYEFSISRPWLFPSYRFLDAAICKRVVKEGSVWTIFQMMALIGTGLDLLIVAYFFGAAEVAKYSVMVKLQTGLMMAQMLSAPLWPAFAEAIERRDFSWARRTFRLSMVICTTLGLVGALILVFLSPWIIQLWVGIELIPSLLLAFGFGMWSLITNYFAGIAALMANQRLLPALTKLTATAALVSFCLKILVVPFLGPDFVIWATVFGYGLVCLPGYFAVNHLLKREESLIPTENSINFNK